MDEFKKTEEKQEQITETVLEKEPDKVGPVFVGQKWVELNGTFTFDELRDLANRIEKSFNKAFKK